MSEHKRIMREFCNIIMPGHDNTRGYINVSSKVSKLGITRRTYYNWKNGESTPNIQYMLNKLNERGYTLVITPVKNFYE